MLLPNRSAVRVQEMQPEMGWKGCEKMGGATALSIFKDRWQGMVMGGIRARDEGELPGREVGWISQGNANISLWGGTED